MPEVVARSRIIHRDDDKSPRKDIAAGSRVTLNDDTVKHLASRGAVERPAVAERQMAARTAAAASPLEGVAQRDPGPEAEQRAAAERAARATGGNGNVSREQPPPSADEL